MHTEFHTEQESFTAAEVEDIIRSIEEAANGFVSSIMFREKIARRIAMLSLIVAIITSFTLFMYLN